MRTLLGATIAFLLLIAAAASGQEVSLGGGADPDEAAVAISQFDRLPDHLEIGLRAFDSRYMRVSIAVTHLVPASRIVVSGPTIPGVGAAANQLVYEYPVGANDEQILSGLIFGQKLTVAVYSPDLGSAALSISKVLRQQAPLQPWESIFGDDDQQPLLEVDRAEVQAAARSVAYLSVVTPNWDLENCTGFVVGPRTIMTNNHCIADATECAGATIVFDYFVDLFHSTTMGIQVGCESVLATDYDLDFTVVRTTADLPADIPALKLLSTSPVADEPAFMVHHPGGEPKTVSMIGCLPIDIAVPGRGEPPSSEDFSHRCDFAGGSSGAPILVARAQAGDTGYCVGGLHHWGFVNSGDYRDKNRAVMTSAILAKTRAAAIQISECN